jgi:hypothetical protein
MATYHLAAFPAANYLSKKVDKLRCGFAWSAEKKQKVVNVWLIGRECVLQSYMVA